MKASDQPLGELPEQPRTPGGHQHATTRTHKPRTPEGPDLPSSHAATVDYSVMGKPDNGRYSALVMGADDHGQTSTPIMGTPDLGQYSGFVMGEDDHGQTSTPIMGRPDFGQYSALVMGIPDHGRTGAPQRPRPRAGGRSWLAWLCRR
jgi:hypothetical protein